MVRQMTDEEKKDLGLKIKSARKQKGLSQEQLADLVGYKVGTISKYEQGYRTPDIGMLRKIAVALDCNLAELAGMYDEVITDEDIIETIRFEEAVENYIDWLRSVHILLTTPSCRDKVGKEKTAIIVDIDGASIDIADKMNDIMQMGKEHFKLLAKHFGKSIYAD